MPGLAWPEAALGVCVFYVVAQGTEGKRARTKLPGSNVGQTKATDPSSIDYS